MSSSSEDPGVASAIGGDPSMPELQTGATGRSVKLKVYRGDGAVGGYKEYDVPLDEGMVVLDAVHQVQAEQDPELACRWNCKAGKCGSCSAEINGRPALMCMTRVSDLPEDKPIQIAPLKAFPIIKDLATDVSWNYRVNEKIEPFAPRPLKGKEKEKGQFNLQQRDVERVQEFRKCIECYLCQDVCHILRTHQRHDEFGGPRFMVRYASLEMHPADEGDRVDHAWEEGGIGMCNITKCCTEVCPEHITITDNAIIPMKERVVSRKFDPIAMLARKLRGKK